MINPNVVEGQIAGGAVQGMGGVLYEHLAYDEAGNPLATTFMDYLLPTAAEIPVIEYGHVETASPGPGGYKGVGEGGALGAPAAVVNAVADALAPLGVTITRQPLGPAQIVALLAERGSERARQATVRGLARCWHDGWNRGDLDTIMAPFAPDVVFSSPFVPRFTGDPAKTTIEGVRRPPRLRGGGAAPVAGHPVHARRDLRRDRRHRARVPAATTPIPAGPTSAGADSMRVDPSGRVVEWRCHYDLAPSDRVSRSDRVEARRAEGVRRPRDGGRQADAAGLEVGGEALGAELAAEARLLEAAEGHERERRVRAVDGDAAGPQPPGDARAPGRRRRSTRRRTGRTASRWRCGRRRPRRRRG